MPSSKLQQHVARLLSNRFGSQSFVECFRPEWLRGVKGCNLELDFFLSDYNAAIEVQGRQHYVFTPIFHQTEDAFEEQLFRDAYKRRICEERGILFLEVYDESSAEDSIQLIGNSRDDLRFIERELNKLADAYACEKSNAGRIIEIATKLEKMRRKLAHKGPNARPTLKPEIDKTSKQYAKLQRKFDATFERNRAYFLAEARPLVLPAILEQLHALRSLGQRNSSES